MSVGYVVLFALFLSFDDFLMASQKALLAWGLLFPLIYFFFLGAFLFNFDVKMCSTSSYE